MSSKGTVFIALNVDDNLMIGGKAAIKEVVQQVEQNGQWPRRGELISFKSLTDGL